MRRALLALCLMMAWAAESQAERLPTTYDPVFRSECPRLPVEYLRALAKRESDFNAGERKGHAWGLLQVVPSVRRAYNRRHGTAYTRRDLLDPAINARIACDLLERIRARYRRHYGARLDDASMQSRRFVAILTLAWNAGWSERGVGGALRRLRYPTLDAIGRLAERSPHLSRHLRNGRKRAWVRGVVRLYFRALRAHPRNLW